MKVILSGGGTGGHIYPALTIAGTLQRLDPQCEITFVGTKKGLEKDIIPRYGYPLEFIEVAGFERHLGLSTLKSAGKLLVGMQEAYSLLGKIQPDLVIGTGGYVCGPILFWAAWKKIPTCIQEQNAMPGVTNKILSRFVDKVFLGYQEAGKFFSSHGEKLFTGNPVRQEILEANREDGVQEFHLDPKKKTLLVFGGSRGARAINTAMVEVERALAHNPHIQILHATGTAGYEKHIAMLGKEVMEAENIHVLPYLHAMPKALAAADLAVSRAGAIGLAELMARGIPSILVPYPYATANHQEYNARALAAQGAAEVVLDKELTGTWLLDKMQQLFKDPDLLQKMHQAALAAARPDAAMTIAQAALALAKQNEEDIHRG